MGTSRRRELSPAVRQIVTICLLTTVVFLVQGCNSSSDAVAGFSDVSGVHPYAAAISDLAARNIISGYQDGKFGPDDSVTRQQFAKMVVLAMGFAVTEEDSYGFPDVSPIPAALYPYHFVAVAANNGLIMGHADGTFGPFEHLTRMQLISTVARMTASLLREPPSDWRGSLDTSDPTHGEAMRWAEYSGLLQGIGGLATWDAKEATTRGEVSQIVHNLLAATDYRPPLSVLNYGAKGDGVGDDTQAIQRAIDARPAGGTIVLPSGNYVVASVRLKSNISLIGSGVDSVLSSTADYPILISGKSDVVLDSFALRGRYSVYGQAGICITGGANSNIVISNLNISDMGFCGIFTSIMGTLADSRISDCVITHCGDFGISSRGAGSNILIEDCICSDFAGTSEPPHGFYFHDWNDLTIRGCEAHTLGHHPNGYSGLELDNCLRALIENCNMHDCRSGTNADGYGFIAVEATTVAYRDCRGNGNYYDFAELNLTGAASYESCSGSKVAYGS